MQGGELVLKNIHKIFFAHHFYTEQDYKADYGTGQNGIEIVYIKKGNMTGELYGKTFLVEEGSFFVLLRHLPINLYTVGVHSHCSVSLNGDFEFIYTENADNYESKKSGIVLPFVTPPFKETEQLKKDLFLVVSELTVSKEKNEMSAVLLALSILQRLSVNYQKKQGENPSSIIEYKIKKYVANNIASNFDISDIAKELNMTPNYINSVFKKRQGISIRQYINKEKVSLICDLMHHRGVSFKVACENAGIYDVSYGYRLFKKNMGITTKEYMNSIK
ncbi:MAG: helix-turn-helix transcriptional regulator [Clostridia bacterium]|nr:helix-turn-helix transcriptional regulator [Clostridia bacterium]